MTIGGAFTSVITGNLVFVGRAVGTLSPTPALHALVAAAGYVTGVAVGSRLLTMIGRSAPEFAWPKGTTVVLAVECVILAAVNIAWISYGAALPAAATCDWSIPIGGSGGKSCRGWPRPLHPSGAVP